MYERILVAVDGSQPSNTGLDEAIRLARLTGGRLRLVHVVDQLPFVLSAEGYGAMSADVLGLLNEAGQKILADARNRVEAAGVSADTRLHESLSGRLCERVAAEALEWEADLLVLGTHGRRGIRRAFLGSDAEQILRTAPVPVLLVRERGAEVPA